MSTPCRVLESRYSLVIFFLFFADLVDVEVFEVALDETVDFFGGEVVEGHVSFLEHFDLEEGTMAEDLRIGVAGVTQDELVQDFADVFGLAHRAPHFLSMRALMSERR